ncbi:glycerol-3-phosphate dehydrogenase [Parvularcula dongshanensis]|uniref:Glycerol-3-phosphate dehydrogenase n=1 Tax=Parvularcula dongshanensis TaxID=1173995 RepID=A0A840I569_9PROT|nr:glycerol-3-phosphate dehydrogenase [Parvularcula dongshanensis]MBB4659522.1 glycerol-3-phosphate dehydrogenase [Parvularcula dongshanensis]
MYDLLVIGGGINGVGVARDAAGRGLRVLLCERDDLASHTSSASTKLIHGGLRYLEHYEFKLVRESLVERERLLGLAPHIIWPLRFVLPHHKGLRPAWFLRLGLFLYDHLGGREALPGTRSVDLTAPPHAGILGRAYEKGFEYSDCWVEDARLVVLSAVDAQERGAEVLTGTACTGLTRHEDRWDAALTSAEGSRVVEAKAVVNAAGPWVGEVAGLALRGRSKSSVRLVKGSHVVVPKLYEGGHAYIFQNTDDRIVFAIPYEDDFTLIGTTDVPLNDPNEAVAATDEEVAYLCKLASDYFATPVTPADIVWTYAGVRPLFDDAEEDASKVTRDYELVLDHDGGAPILSVYGGKITTFRHLAEDALRELADVFPQMGEAWTQDAPLPGGDLGSGFDAFAARFAAAHAWLPAALARRLCRAYGTRAEHVLGEATSLADLGEAFAARLTEAELRYLVEAEFARGPDDVLWRRSKLGLHMTEAERASVAAWFDRR